MAALNAWPAGMLSMPEGHLGASFDRLEALARSRPDEPAITYFGRTVSHADLHGASQHLAGYLQQHLGVTHGDRVLLLMRDCPQCLISRLAIQRCDAVVVDLGAIGTAAEIEHFAEHSGARVILLTEDLRPRIEKALAQGCITAAVVAACSDVPGENASTLRVPAIDFAFRPRRPGGGGECRELHDFADALSAGIEPRPSRPRSHTAPSL